MEFRDGVVFVDDTKIKLGYPVGKQQSLNSSQSDLSL